MRQRRRSGRAPGRRRWSRHRLPRAPEGPALTPPPAPEVSVVIPTRNRARSLERTLAALAMQSLPPTRFEVLVAANGCTDGTAALVRARRDAPAVRLVEQPTASMSRARDQGASAARGHVLVFLDDDVEPVPDFSRRTPACIARERTSSPSGRCWFRRPTGREAC